ncbi:hypothetical protein NDU88_002516 [Pleurodeles waltl]|uniref:Uncharacterized protein n=1 Tax=Pleurodeles waltl TaxID=8319 RepID=A0AAV7P9W8_PLEWA|nr:hypothetical protein NDU88_002516 [Pleurodeles waltl]
MGPAGCGSAWGLGKGTGPNLASERWCAARRRLRGFLPACRKSADRGGAYLKGEAAAWRRVRFDRRGGTDALGGIGNRSRRDSCLPPELGLDVVSGKDAALRRIPVGELNTAGPRVLGVTGTGGELW